MLQMSKHYEPEFKKKIVRLHLEEVRTLKGLAAEYGVSKASISIWVKQFREECQTNEEAKADYDFFSIITMICKDFKISGETDGKTVVCNSFPAMERGFYKIAEHKPEVLDDIKKHEIFDYIKNNQHMGKEAGTRHKKNIAAYKETLEEMKTQKICPYCKLDSFCVREKTASFMDAEISPSVGMHLKNNTDSDSV